MTISKLFLSAVVLVCLVLGFSGKAHGEAFTVDKQQHIAVSFAIAAPAAVYLRDTDHPVLYGAAVALVPGVLKEVYDAANPEKHTASIADLVADAVGAFSGALIGHGVYVFADRDRAAIVFSGTF